ncbi:hypothetical protein QO004_005041 [Rhizobium mesoamericanum]|uniref:hypothetical protein n=1 Tax=Rhizobium mesoamericanum TaxID=1079800 RepID=UPI002780B479|nr:hypothetical protein [Rhizobium mesoamericanum]MDQ0563232.1 hypothetical protein [Rhizobium mesoamericanum]
MLAGSLVALGATVGITKLLDIFLSDAQKARIERWLYVAWSMLDDLKAFNFSSVLARPLVRLGFALFAILATIALFFTVLSDWILELSYGFLVFLDDDLGMPVWLDAYRSSNKPLIVMAGFFLTLSVAAAFVGRWLVAFILRSGKPLHNLMRAVGLSLVAAVPVSAFASVSVPSLGSTGRIFLVPMIIGWWYTATIVIVYWAAATVPLLLAYLSSVLLHTFEFLARRIAEYPSGPVLTIGACCGGAAAIITALT